MARTVVFSIRLDDKEAQKLDALRRAEAGGIPPRVDMVRKLIERAKLSEVRDERSPQTS